MRAAALLTLSLLGLAGAQRPDDTHYTVTINGRVYDQDEIRVRNLGVCRGTVLVRGVHNGFDINCSNMNMYNYTFTAAVNSPDGKPRMFDRPTTVFASKEISLTPAQIGTPTIDEFRLQNGAFRIIFNSPGGVVKYQSKDRPQGGLFQLETEFGFNATHTITLAPGIFYFLNPNQDNAVRIGNGIRPDSSFDPFIGRDSPQAANRISQDGRVARWNVWSGGRIGAVFGEDALENAPPATVCTSDCQAQNQVRGSLPVTEMPDYIVPIGEDDEDDD